MEPNQTPENCCRDEESACLFARRMLKERTRRVRQLLREAAKHGEDDSEVIHDLRVATRRVIACLETFECLMPEEELRELQRRACRIRRAAGAARNADVLLPHLVARGERLSRALLVALLSKLSRKRAAAQRKLRRAFGKCHRKQWKRVSRRCYKGIEKDPPDAQQPSAKAMLVQATSESIQALRPFVTSGLADAQELHLLRLQCKQLRYLLEIAATGDDQDGFRTLFEAVKEAQERLGRINDQASANRRLRKWLAKWSDDSTISEFQAFVEAEEAAFERSGAAFREWWHDRHLCDLARSLSEAG